MVLRHRQTKGAATDRL